MSLERAKRLASDWIAHGQGLTAISRLEWDDMTRRAKADGINVLPRRVILNTAHDTAKALNDMVIADSYDDFRLNVFENRLLTSKRNIESWRRYLAPKAEQARQEKETAIQGTMNRLDKKITGGTTGLKISQAWDVAGDVYDKVKKKIEAGLKPITDPFGSFAERMGVPKPLLIGGLAIGGFFLLKAILPTLVSLSPPGRAAAVAKGVRR